MSMKRLNLPQRTCPCPLKPRYLHYRGLLLVVVIIVLFDSSLLIHLIHLSSFIIFLSPPLPFPLLTTPLPFPPPRFSFCYYQVSEDQELRNQSVLGVSGKSHKSPISSRGNLQKSQGSGGGSSRRDEGGGGGSDKRGGQDSGGEGEGGGRGSKGMTINSPSSPQPGQGLSPSSPGQGQGQGEGEEEEVIREPPFPPERLSECMRQAMDSRYNVMMSAVAREQGTIG